MIDAILALAILAVAAFVYYIKIKSGSAMNDGKTTKKAADALQTDSQPATPAAKSEGGSTPTSASEKAPRQLHTRELFLQTLTAIGCQYEVDEHDRVCFAYQGEHFVVDADNDTPYITIYDFAWHIVPMSDIDEISRLRRAVNEVNWQNSVTTLFTIDNEDNSMVVHCKVTIVFVRQLHDLQGYLRIELAEFFRAHRLLADEMAKLRAKENAREVQQA